MLVLSEPLRVVRQWVCGRSLAAIVGSSTVGGMDICLSVVSVVCCQGEVSATGRSFVQSSSRERQKVCVS